MKKSSHFLKFYKKSSPIQMLCSILVLYTKSEFKFKGDYYEQRI